MRGTKFLLGLFWFLPFFNFSQVISPLLFGQNAWMPDTIGNAQACTLPPCVLWGQLHQNWSNVKLSNAAIIRFGGIQPDRNCPTNFQYIKMIDSIRAKGMEPVMQVPFHNNLYTPQQAAAIVQYVNITRGKNVKYWIIGNEPDYEYSYTTSAQVAAYFRPFASAMKAADPSILTIGPECSWFNTNIINGLTTPNGPDDITGTDMNGRYYCDIISFHYYPFNGTQTYAQVLTKINLVNGLNANLATLNSRLANCNAAHNRTGLNALRSAITEANVNTQNPPADNIYGVGSNSFLGGQFIAEVYDAGMKNGVHFISVWSVIEGSNNSLNVGYLDVTNGNKKSMFWHYKLLADNFSGNYLSAVSTQSNVKVFGCQNAQSISVMILNEDQANNYNFTLRLNNGTVTGNNPLRMNLSSNIAVEYNDVIMNQGSILLQFDLQGNLMKKCVYTLANHNAYNLPPSCEIFGLLPIELKDFRAELNNDDHVILNWETASEKNNRFFTVQRSRDGEKFEDVGTVPAAGNSVSPKVYAFTDELPLAGYSYYRLKQTDYEGSFVFSAIRMINYNPDKGLNIYPNPNDGSVMHIGAGPGTQISFRLMDMQGREIEGSLNSSDHGLEFRPSRPLSKGIYLVQINSGSRSISKKLLVQ
jgi:hypothetical protein